MNLFARQDLMALIDKALGPCLSLYIPAPTSDADFRCRVGTLVEDIRPLMVRGYHTAFVEQFIQEFMAAMTEMPRQEAGQSVAVFYSRQVKGYFRHDEAWPQLSVVSDSFHIKPLLPWLQAGEDYFLLYTSCEHMAAWSGTSSSLRSLWEESDPDLGLARRPLRVGETLAPTRDRLGKMPFSLEEKRNLVRYFRALDMRLRSHLHERETPLILAGDPTFHDFFLMVSKYRYVTRDVIHPDVTDRATLHRKAQAISQHRKTIETRQTTELFRKLRPKGMATDELHTIVNATAKGRVRTLMIEKGAQLWGNFNPKTGKIQSHKWQMNAHDDDIYDDLAELVIKKGGKVLLMDNVVPMPTHAPIAAILR